VFILSFCYKWWFDIHFSLKEGGGLAPGGKARFYGQVAPDLNFRIFHSFEPGEEFEVDALLPSSSPENVTADVLSISGQSGSSVSACLSVCIEPQFCYPPGMQGASLLCASHKDSIKIIRSCINAFDGFRVISIIAIQGVSRL